MKRNQQSKRRQASRRRVPAANLTAPSSPAEPWHDQALTVGARLLNPTALLGKIATSALFFVLSTAVGLLGGLNPLLVVAGTAALTMALALTLTHVSKPLGIAVSIVVVSSALVMTVITALKRRAESAAYELTPDGWEPGFRRLIAGEIPFTDPFINMSVANLTKNTIYIKYISRYAKIGNVASPLLVDKQEAQEVEELLPGKSISCQSEPLKGFKFNYMQDIRGEMSCRLVYSRSRKGLDDPTTRKDYDYSHKFVFGICLGNAVCKKEEF